MSSQFFQKPGVCPSSGNSSGGGLSVGSMFASNQPENPCAKIPSSDVGGIDLAQWDCAPWRRREAKRTLALPKAVEHWPLTSLREELVKIGAKVVSHGRYVTLKLAEVAVSRALFAQVLGLIANLRAPPPKPA